MTGRLFGICVIACSGWCLSAASAARAEDFVKIEVQGKLDQGTFNRGPDQYSVVVNRKNDKQTFLLILPDDAMQKAAKELVGQVVIVTGDGVRGGVITDGTRKQTTKEVTWITVKSLKKVDKPNDPKKRNEPHAPNQPR
jgi:hypothetical protein